MTDTHDLSTAEQHREVILYAAVAELAGKRLGDFTVEGVAARAGLPVHCVKQLWPNTPELLTAALLKFGEDFIPIPDTGTLRGDLLEYSRSYAAAANTEIGRRLLDALIVSPRDWDVAGTRQRFLSGPRHERLTPIFRRAAERGECAAGLDGVLLIDLLASCLCNPVIFYDQRVSDEHCQYVVDLFLNGISPRQ